MKYDIVYGCGHAGTVDLWGKGKERESRLARLQASGLCPDCKAKAKQDKREAEYAQGIALAEEFGLPDLTGTDKQIKWAVSLRGKLVQVAKDKVIDKLSHLDNVLANQPTTMAVENAVKYERQLAGINSVWEAIHKFVASHPEASYWIDNREEYDLGGHFAWDFLRRNCRKAA